MRTRIRRALPAGSCRTRCPSPAAWDWPSASRNAPIKPDKDLVAVFRPAGDGYENVTASETVGTESLRPCLGQVPGRIPAVGGHFALVRRQVLRQPADAGRDGEVPGHHDGRLHPQHRRPVRQARARRLHRRAAPGARRAACPGRTICRKCSSKRWGYDLIDSLPSLVRPVGDWKRVRHNYLQILLDLFIERWAKPYYEYCDKHGLEFTGHYWEHEWPNCLMSPDNMAMYAWHQRPAIDILMNQYDEDVHAQFGNVRVGQGAVQRGQPARPHADAVRGLRRRRLGPAVRGHEADRRLALRPRRQHDGRAPLLHHDPRRPQARPSAVVLLSRALVEVVPRDGRVLHAALADHVPGPAGEPHPRPRADDHGLDVPGRSAASSARSATASSRCSSALEQAQVEYDLGCEDIIAHHGSTEGTRLKVGQRAYDIVVLPPRTENLNAANDGPAGRLSGRRRQGALLRRGARAASTAARRTAARRRPNSPAGNVWRRKISQCSAGRSEGRVRHPSEAQDDKGNPVPSQARGGRRRVPSAGQYEHRGPFGRQDHVRRPEHRAMGPAHGRGVGVSLWERTTPACRPSSSFRRAAVCCCSCPKKAQAPAPATQAEDQRDRGQGRSADRAAGGERPDPGLSSMSRPAARRRRACTSTRRISSPSPRTACRAIRGTAPSSSRTS